MRVIQHPFMHHYPPSVRKEKLSCDIPMFPVPILSSPSSKKLLYPQFGFSKIIKVFSGGSGGKESSCQAGDMGSIPGLGRSLGEGNGYPLQYSCLENSMDRGAWRTMAHGVTKSWSWLSNLHFLFTYLQVSSLLLLLLLFNL